MVKLVGKTTLIKEIKNIIENSPYEYASRAHGRAGLLLEHLLGIKGGNHDVADAVGFELKTSVNPNTPLTLFHREALPRGSCKTLVHRYGWDSTYKESHVKSFRATIYGSWKSQTSPTELRIVANLDKISILDKDECISYWDANNLITIAASKLRNMMLVFAKINNDETINFTSAFLLEKFQPIKFINAINSGIIAIDFDARTNPNSRSIRNHGTKFRIKEKDLLHIYETVELFS